jgi:hypothetical protein
MGNFFRGIVSFLGVGVVWLIVGACAIFYITAFKDGVHEWIGWEGFFVNIIAVALMMFLGPLGMTLVAIVGGYGAYYVWEWPLWITVIAFFPGLAFMIGGLLVSLTTALLQRRTI